MLLKNETDYNGRDLRKLILACMKHEGVDHNGYYVKVYYSKRHNSTCGWGYYNRKKLGLGLPKYLSDIVDGKWKKEKIEEEMPVWLVKSSARVIVHEIGHNLGLKHGDMVESHSIDVSFCEGFNLRVRGAKTKAAVKASMPLVEKRSEHVKAKIKGLEESLRKLETRKKGLVTRLKSWRKKDKYYDKKESGSSSNL